MPGQRGTEKRALSDAALVRMAPKLAGQVREAAAAEGITIASWIRRLVAATLGEAPEPVLAAYRPPRPAPSVDVVAVAELREALGEATGAIRRSAVFCREEGFAETRALLEELHPLYRQLADDVAALKRDLEARG